MNSVYTEPRPLEEVARSLCELIQADVRRLGYYSFGSWEALLDALRQAEKNGARAMRGRVATLVEEQWLAATDPTLVRQLDELHRLVLSEAP